MKLTQLSAALAVAERGGLRAAARHLGVAQPALTRGIAELERELGVPLFERRARGVVVTPTGAMFLRRASAVLAEVRRAREEVEQAAGGTGGTVTVGLSSVPLMSLVPDAMAAFRARFPDVRLQLAEGAFPLIEPGLKDGTVDCYVGPQPGAPLAPELVREVLFTNTRGVMCRAGHPLAAARSLRELAGAEWLATSITHRADEELEEIFRRHGLGAPRITMQGQSALSIMVQLLWSDALAFVPVQWTDFPLVAPHLVQIPIREKLEAPAIVLVKRAGLPLTPAAEFFCDLMRRGSVAMKRGRGTAPAAPVQTRGRRAR
jgi:DNA-binding transcriptional LysR family regulator